MKIKRGDTVKVIVGKDKGKTGKVEKIFLRKNQILVAGVNIYKRHLKPQGEGKPGGIVEINKPLSVAKVALVCSQCQQTTRVGFLIDKKGEKNRICKKCQQLI